MTVWGFLVLTLFILGLSCCGAAIFGGRGGEWVDQTLLDEHTEQVTVVAVFHSHPLCTRTGRHTLKNGICRHCGVPLDDLLESKGKK
jgi:hypothetical protein